MTLGADDSADLGEGNDFIVVTGTGTLSADVVLKGGEGFDRLTATGHTTQTLSNTTLALTSGAVNHEGFEDYVLIGTAGADTLDASGLAAGELTAATRLSTLNNGAGLPIRSLDNDAIEVVDSSSGTPVTSSFDTGERAYDLKVIHPDGTEAYVDLTVLAETMQDVLDAFNAVNGLTATISGGALVITSSLAGAGALRFEGVEVTDSTAQGNSGTPQNIYVDTSMLEALGLSGMTFSGATVTAGLSSGTSVLIDGAAGDDTLTGSAGDDLIIAGAGTDNIAGGAGYDHLLLSRSAITGAITIGAANASSASGTDSYSGIELIEARGDATAQNVDAGSWTGDFLYRTGGGADTITKSAGANTVVVDGNGIPVGLSLSGGAATPDDDQVIVELSGTVTGDLSSSAAGITDPITFGAVPMLAEDLRLTRVDDSVSNDITFGANTYFTAGGVVKFQADSIVVSADIVQTGGTPETNRLIFETT
ncbi:MAG: hypothetical protein VX201_04825, partial [Pseudomonadota bacterium]|nr:hypothetical protein [Pseudomonadota bacterium]